MPGKTRAPILESSQVRHLPGKEQQMSDTPNPATERTMRRLTLFKGLLAGGLLGGLIAGAGWAHSHGGFGRACGWHGAGMDPAAAAQRLEFATDWSLSRIGASEEQKGRVRAIAQATLDDLLPLREAHQADRDRLKEALLAPAIDRARIESLRQDEMQLAQQASARIAQAVADAAEVLTPEQRGALMLHFESRRHGRWS
jgi:Spy/CpxP family protein refolding chaperone